MTRREWLSAVWAEWAPSYREGRVDIGRFVIMSRKELSLWAQEHHSIGAHMQQEDPATAARLAALIESESQSDESLAVVRPLRAVRA